MRTPLLHSSSDPFATLIEMTAAALSGRPFSPAPGRPVTETDAERLAAAPSAPAQTAPASTVEARSCERGVLYRYY